MTTGVDKATGADGTIAVMLEQARKRVPNLVALKKRVDAGDTLSDLEIIDLDETFERARRMLHIYDEREDVHELVAHIVSMYLHIIQHAIENEKAGGIPPTIDLSD